VQFLKRDLTVNFASRNQLFNFKHTAWKQDECKPKKPCVSVIDHAVSQLAKKGLFLASAWMLAAEGSKSPAKVILLACK